MAGAGRVRLHGVDALRRFLRLERPVARPACWTCSRTRPAPAMSPSGTLCGFIKHSERPAAKVQGRCGQKCFSPAPGVRRRLPHQYAPRQAMSTVEDIAHPRARRRCYNIAITRQSWPAVASRPAVARMWPDKTWPGRPWLADGGRTRLRGDVTAVTSPSSVGRGDVRDRGHRLSRSVLTGESACHTPALRGFQTY